MESTRHTAPPAPAVTARPVPAPRGRARIPAIARAAGRGCSRPGCDTPAAATLIFSYHEQVARLVELIDEREPQAYDLCGPHADRTSPPRGWELGDARVPRGEAPRRLDDDDTVAVLAAALRGDAPTARVEVLEGGAVDADAADVDAPDAADTMDEAGHDAELYLGPEDPIGDYVDEDPLRAALEEVQRVVEPDAETPGAVPTPLRPEDDLTLW